VSEIPAALAALRERLRACDLCPRRCGVDRLEAEEGQCRSSSRARVCSVGAHFGEEQVLVGRGGSGTIFLSGCNLGCVFCQNSDISQGRAGSELEAILLAGHALELASRGCENVNFVTPSHQPHAVLEAIWLARQRGLRLPVVYNCGGYESVETLRPAESLVDIYMPDFKYADPDAGLRYSGVPDYPQVAAAALAEMFRQVGPLQLDERGVARRGVLVRHLVLPQDLARSEQVVERVAALAPGAGINVMAQYRPAYRARRYPELARSLAGQTVARLRRRAAALGLLRVDGGW